jgi:hypothetical protein
MAAFEAIAAAATSAEPAGPTIDILGVRLTGGAAWAAFAVSVISILRATVDLVTFARRKLVPLQLEIFAWDSTTDPGNEPATQLKIDIYNNGGEETRLMRLQTVYDPGWWKRRVPRWHRRNTLTPPRELTYDRDERDLSLGGNQFHAVAIHDSGQHPPLLVIAGLTRTRVRAALAQQRDAPIRTP